MPHPISDLSVYLTRLDRNVPSGTSHDPPFSILATHSCIGTNPDRHERIDPVWPMESSKPE